MKTFREIVVAKGHILDTMIAGMGIYPYRNQIVNHLATEKYAVVVIESEAIDNIEHRILLNELLFVNKEDEICVSIAHACARGRDDKWLGRITIVGLTEDTDGATVTYAKPNAKEVETFKYNLRTENLEVKHEKN